MNLVELLDRQASLRSLAPAIVDQPNGRERVMTFDQLRERSQRLAALMHARGIRSGDCALVFQPMSAELYVVLVALWRVGAVAMFLDPSAGRKYLERCCTMLPPTVLVASARAHLLRFVSAPLRRISHKIVVGCWVPGAVRVTSADAYTPRAALAPVSLDTPALVTFTSGSTGLPKAAVRTHGFLQRQHDVLARHLELAQGDVDLSTLPIFALANLASGVTSVIPAGDLRKVGSIDAAPVFAQIERWGVTRSAASPAFFERLAEYGERKRCSLPTLQVIDTGGAPVFAKLLDRLQCLAPQAHSRAVYGSTEAEPIAHLAAAAISVDDRLAMRHGAGLLAGWPVPEITVRILPPRWGQTLGPYREAAFAADCLGPNVAGEIVVHGAHVLQGYLNGQGDAETKFNVDQARWHRTGDSGYLDERGRLWLLGRVGARIVDAKGELYPFRVECAVAEHTGIRRSAVTSWQGRRVLVVERTSLEATVDVDALHEQLSWASLDAIHLTHRLPVDARHNAKIDYPALAELLARELGASHLKPNK